MLKRLNEWFTCILVSLLELSVFYWFIKVLQGNAFFNITRICGIEVDSEFLIDNAIMSVGILFAFSFGLLYGAFQTEVPTKKMCQSVLPANYATPVIDQAKMKLYKFKPLIAINCSTLTLLFVFLSHLPYCISQSAAQVLLPCLSVCVCCFCALQAEKVKSVKRKKVRK